ncbi:MAG: hypothetical protein UY77_C0009G0020 [Candidatus Uhrbacteria bacterium GW2011_GWA2_53_10]|uniref:NIF system FeS cluster assembly NifU C-terminal domain-containing protein n=1 Tax=Candidatus Uhrbacteria bacterium GW2011_GWA2_53_10 TaxID=1618980 RepID=A0A0G1ZX24_9BACT|nr:MAG: hypothetical protein UY77_C0009G0020 [Candidatus Uhrbacteria bacterium GW2011_GWA2_53_10]
MDARLQIEEGIAHLKPILASAGRAIDVVEVATPKAVIRLSGFCGGCACSDSYKQGLRDLIAERCPELTDISFIEV